MIFMALAMVTLHIRIIMTYAGCKYTLVVSFEGFLQKLPYLWWAWVDREWLNWFWHCNTFWRVIFELNGFSVSLVGLLLVRGYTTAVPTEQ